MNENTKALLQIIRENPELPVIPMVGTEVVADDTYGHWMASFGSVAVDEYLLAKNGYDSILFKSDDDVFDTLEKMLPEEELDKLPDSEAECRPFYDALPWKKAIIVYIETPDTEEEPKC